MNQKTQIVDFGTITHACFMCSHGIKQHGCGSFTPSRDVKFTEPDEITYQDSKQCQICGHLESCHKPPIWVRIHRWIFD